MIEDKVKKAVRVVPDFPKKGILFKDITPILKQPELCQEIIEQLRSDWQNQMPDVIAGIESRGFLFGFRLAAALNIPFVLMRKPGKLPYHKISHSYQLEYGDATIELQKDDITPGQKVLIHDDLLATGGTAIAAGELVKKEKGEVLGYSFLIELDALEGRKKLKSISSKIISLVHY